VRPLVEPYDAAIFTLPEYVQPDLRVPILAYIPPSIDPRSAKNVQLDPALADDVVHRLGVDPTRPLLLQVSRFDPWKDPKGVIDTYRAVKQEIPGIQLALVGSMATDDPEGWLIYKDVLRYAGMDPDISILTNLDGVGAVEVNAFQHASDVVLQKSLREGFGLTVTEAMWKGAAVIGGNVGGIKHQIEDGVNGFLVDNVEQAAARIVDILKDAALRERVGRNATETVRRRFLMTRLMEDWLDLLGSFEADFRFKGAIQS